VPSDCTAAETEHKRDISLAYMADVLRCDVRPSSASVTQRKPARKRHA